MLGLYSNDYSNKLPVYYQYLNSYLDEDFIDSYIFNNTARGVYKTRTYDHIEIKLGQLYVWVF
ncbi:hypothetical protein [Endozoicomonas sp. ONNA1]|uniref:hypothetical protein n=1 Tax=Endozoicomonas sp. ONNA1 TaxID=2828740 RepID=UPI00214814C9|nr:hypothetical protein [Endozoicomonas sp. ONNA1]